MATLPDGQVALVAALAERIRIDRSRLNVLVNDIQGGNATIDWSAKFWKTIEAGLAMKEAQAHYAKINAAPGKASLAGTYAEKLGFRGFTAGLRPFEG